jgi:alpha-ketoglutarate-dependent taurine dioxygenase
MRIDRLPGSFGVEISGVDVARADEAALRAVAEALYANRLVVLRGQKLAKEQYLAFGRRWGRPIPHVLDHLRMAGYPELMAVGNTEEKDKTDDIRNGAAFWHTDQSYEAAPASVTMLHAILVPKEGGETMFADCASAYDALAPEMKARIDGLRAKHFYGAGSGRDGEKIAAPIVNDEQERKVPPVLHLIAKPHPVTGRKALYAPAGTAYAVEGMEDEAARALLTELKDHVLKPAFRTMHKYRVGDLAVWDTWQTLHSAVPIETPKAEEEKRLLWRISARGLPDFLQRRAAAE